MEKPVYTSLESVVKDYIIRSLEKKGFKRSGDLMRKDNIEALIIESENHIIINFEEDGTEIGRISINLTGQRKGITTVDKANGLRYNVTVIKAYYSALSDLINGKIKIETNKYKNGGEVYER